MRFFIPFLFSVLMIHSANAVPGARVVERFGFKDAIELTNGTCTVVITPAVGGKIMSYKLGEKEALEINPNERGDRKPEDGDEWNVNWAGRFDFGPETQVPSHPELWHGPWKGEITGPRQATLTSIRHEASGAQLVRTFTLAAKGSHLSCKQTVINISNEKKRFNHWSRTFGKGGGIVFVPLSDWSRYKNHYVMYEPEGRVNLVPEDKNIRMKANTLIISGAPQYPKLGLDSMEGWFSYLIPSDLLFVKKYNAYPDRVYGDPMAMTISIWYVENYRDGLTTAEIEPKGPLETLYPGERMSFTEEWYLTDHPFPEDKANIDVESVLAASKKVIGL